MLILGIAIGLIVGAGITGLVVILAMAKAARDLK